MEKTKHTLRQSDWLIFLGVLLFLFGLITGFFIPLMTNSRMGLTAHLEGVMNGMFLIILGLIWNRILLPEKWLTISFWLVIYGSFANFAAVTIAAITGGGKMMPIAGGQEGTPVVEGLLSFLLVSLSLAMVFVCIIVLSGLMRYIKQSSDK